MNIGVLWVKVLRSLEVFRLCNKPKYNQRLYVCLTHAYFSNLKITFQQKMTKELHLFKSCALLRILGFKVEGWLFVLFLFSFQESFLSCTTVHQYKYFSLHISVFKQCPQKSLPESTKCLLVFICLFLRTTCTYL